MQKAFIVLAFLASVLLAGKTMSIANDKDLVTSSTSTNIVDTENVSNTEISTYIREQESALNDEKTLTKSSLKECFITLTDFIFYGGTINNKTFNELTDEVKIQVLTYYNNLNNKIDEKYPGLREEIKKQSSKTYTNIKERTIELKDKVLNSYKEKVGEEAYNELVKTINDDLERYKESVAPVEEKIGEAYQNTKNKLDTWYQKFKESSD